ncbi:hypothetical protein [Paraglaciecola sp.]|uniref:hypothetical protein n=1 Tax=Paraglaciecola sp. TaxID=1920173 RepID=UPI003EF36074
MSRKIKTLTLLILTQFLYIQIADAGLLRTTGRGSLSSNFDQAFHYVDNSYLRMNSLGITDDSFDSFLFNRITKGVGGGGRGLGAAPSSCVNGYTQDQVDDFETDRDSQLYALPSDSNYDASAAQINNSIDQQIQAMTVGEPCAWEFDEGEDLFAFGFFSLFFGTPDVAYDVNWLISGEGQTWSLPGSVNTVPDLDTADGIVEEGWVTLNTSAPVDLFAGDYTISVNVALSSTNGSFFWENGDSNDTVELTRKCEFNPAWDAYYSVGGEYEQWQTDYFAWEDAGSVGTAPVQPTEPADEICGTASYNNDSGLRSNAPTLFYSETEILRILPINSVPDNQTVNTPASLGVLLFGLGFLMNRKRSHLKKET